jgi:hypothetical protein
MKHTIGLSFQVRMGENQKYKQGPRQPLTPDSESTLLEFSGNELKIYKQKIYEVLPAQKDATKPQPCR